VTEEKPRHIICAVRPRPLGQETVSRAIDLAIESGARLTFFYAVDAEFKAQATVRGPLSVIYRELVAMSEFAMLILCERARRRGVEQVDYLIREGTPRKQLLRLAAETHADTLVIGWPLRGPGRSAFKPEEFDAFLAELEQAGNPRLVTVAPAVDEDATASTLAHQ
jgi:nucleotide-binding universal stress UspA family protein